MAHSTTAARSRMASKFSRNITSSPVDEHHDLYATATSFNNILHSTPQARRDDTGQLSRIPLDYDQFPDPLSEQRSDISVDMSVEIGRGHKRGRVNNDDMSSNAVFGFANDHSRSEMVDNPKTIPRISQRKSDGVVRKESSARCLTDILKISNEHRDNSSGGRQPAVPGKAARPRIEDETEEIEQPMSTYRVHSSRFSSTQHISASYGGIPMSFTAEKGLQLSQPTPRKSAAANPTIQSATFTANQSFMLPDLSNINELVSGPQKDATATFKRSPASRSRFTSASQKVQTDTHFPVIAVPIPEDEKAIVASLNMLHGRVAQLEMDKSEAEKRIGEYEEQIHDLHNQLKPETVRPDSGLGLDKEESRSSREENSRLQTKIRALQDRLDRSERKISISEISVIRVTRERDTMLSQVSRTYHQNEELVKENTALCETLGNLQAENDDLRSEIDSLKNGSAIPRKEAAQWKTQDDVEDVGPPGTRSTYSATLSRGTGHSANEQRQSSQVSATLSGQRFSQGRADENSDLLISHALPNQNTYRNSDNNVPQDSMHGLASRIQLEVQKRRENSRLEKNVKDSYVRDRLINPQKNAPHVRSQSATRSLMNGKDHPSQSRPLSATGSVSGQQQKSCANFCEVKTAPGAQADDDDRTELSTIDCNAVANLRRKLEEEHRASRLKKKLPGQMQYEKDEITNSDAQPSLPRKSSLKGISHQSLGNSGRISLDDVQVDELIKDVRTVRVQSPHSSAMIEPESKAETEDFSITSNTSRRRRRPTGMDGETSAFIVPDITMQSSRALPLNLVQNCIHHNAASCTICSQEAIDVPRPVPVTDRREHADMTDATIRPSQSPTTALAVVIKDLEDEIKHLKIQRDAQNDLYNQHDPAWARSKRQRIKMQIDQLTTEIERRSDQVYALYDVLEGQKQAAAHSKTENIAFKEMDEQDVEDTLQSIGIEPAELSGRLGRSAQNTFDDTSSNESELPWEGLSDVESMA